ncbi:calycin-like domain-containing protein [Leyella lascolaii]|uniref:calycin-like domain-containing protein n=1 Tax=Leyella lascolaii TaxID=1776379 RepID=UPI002942874B|nr:calycin-like domain-containing protein [Leyella lascolaii]
MKRFFTSLLATAAFAVSSMATDYKDMMTVSLDGNPTTPTETTISVEKTDDSGYTLSLKNFVLYMTTGDQVFPMPVGTIVLENVEAVTKGDVTTLKTSQDIEIAEGDDPTYEGSWIGPGLSADGDLIPVNMTGEIRGDKFYTVININFMGMNIDVVFGNGGYQIENSGFENFHTATYVDGKNKYTSDEPNAWHSFNSGIATGSLSFLTKYALQNGNTSVSDDVRPGSTGTKSVAIKSSIVMGFQSANGTMTTGRLQAGSTTATDAANCSFLDMSSTDTDGNGDPFYTVLNGRPDALSVWVKYKQGQVNEQYPYATVSAVITDGTRYQDPEDKAYTNVVAKAQDKTIESKGFEWQNLVIPFDYTSYASNDAQAKALLVTISTNAQPGVGSNDAENPDMIIVDDISLVYNSHLASLKVKGTEVEGFDKNVLSYDLKGEGAISVDDIEAVSDGQGAYVTKAVEGTDKGVKVTITVTSNDLKTTNVYTLNIEGATTTGINKVETTTGKGTAAIYNVNGQRVDNMSQKGLYIIRQADGKTVKVLKK